MDLWRWLGSFLLWAFLFVAAVLAGMPVHEAVHGVLIVLFGGRKSLRFGWDRRTLTPFAHSLRPLRAWQMAVVCLGPLVAMGLVPFVLAVVYGCVFLYALSVRVCRGGWG